MFPQQTFAANSMAIKRCREKTSPSAAMVNSPPAKKPKGKSLKKAHKILKDKKKEQKEKATKEGKPSESQDARSLSSSSAPPSILKGTKKAVVFAAKNQVHTI